MRQNRLLICCALVLALSACQKQNNGEEEQRGVPKYDDVSYLMDGLVKEVAGETVPIRGFLDGERLMISSASVFDAEEHFRSLLPPEAPLRSDGNTLVWSMTDEHGMPQGDAVFSITDAPDVALLSLPEAFGASFKKVVYSPLTTLQSDNPAVLEDLEDNYYYGAIVQISDHGCGSGKFVVFREYNPANGNPGMAVRLDSHHWEHWELILRDNSAKVFGRASSLSTMQQAGEIYRKDKAILSKQLKNAGCTIIDQHYASSTTTWNGWNYYYCLHDGECDWIGPINDTDFYECWIYWFKPQGNSIRFW